MKDIVFSVPTAAGKATVIVPEKLTEADARALAVKIAAILAAMFALEEPTDD